MNLRIWIVLCALALITEGCSKAKGFVRSELNEQMTVGVPEFDEKDIKVAYEKKPNLPRNFKLGVYFKAPAAGPYSEKAWRWTDQDKALIDDVARALSEHGLVGEVFPILSSLVKGDDLKSIRLAAARHQADAVLIVTGAGEVDRYENRWAMTYALIVPAFFIPGSQADTLFVTNATLWDVRNEFLYLTAEAEGTSEDKYAGFMGKKDKILIEEAKTKSMANLRGELAKMIKGTRL